MIYHSHMEKEMSSLGIQEGELAIYTGTGNPRQANGLSVDSDGSNVYVFRWQDGCPLELDARFYLDRANMDVLVIRAGGEVYDFLRDKPSGYMRQVSGPAKPITVANFGVTLLRVDTFLGKFAVYAGTMLRLDENAPQREKKKVLLTLSSQFERPLKSAALWDGDAWRRLNIREDGTSLDSSERCVQAVFDSNGRYGLAVLDGSAIVQYLAVKGNGELLMMDPPEPDPDYEICVTVQAGDKVTLCFNRTEYRDGRVVQRSRTISAAEWQEPDVYDLQKLRESQTGAEMYYCGAKLPEWEAALAPAKQGCLPDSGGPRALPKDGAGPDAPPLEPDGASAESLLEACEAVDGLLEAALLQPAPETRGTPAPEPPGDFPV